MSTKWKPIATLELTVEFEQQVGDDITELAKEIVEKAREYGYPKVAKLRVSAPQVLDLS